MAVVVTGSSAAVSGPISPNLTTSPESADSLLLTLEVTRGQTLFPHRPVAGPRFLIGSGEGCHLRLGGPDLPTLHSLVVIEGTEVTLEAIAAEPELRVNGRCVTSAVLSHGDRIEIGPFHLTARMIPAHVAPQSEIETELHEFEDDERKPADMSALELVERLEGELRMVGEFDSRRELGAGELLSAIRFRQGKSLVPPSRESTLPRTDRVWRVDGAGLSSQPHFTSTRPVRQVAETNEVVFDDLQRLQDDLQRFSRLLEERAERLSRQEASVADAAAELFEAQQRLSRQLDGLLSHTKSQAESQQSSGTPVRAIA
jgi:hypothetical protein